MFQNKKKFTLQEHVENFTNASQFSLDDLKPLIKYPSAFQQLLSSNNFPTKHITSELDIFKDSIYNEICNCSTNIGKSYFNSLLNNPCYNTNILQKRQQLLLHFCQNYKSELRNNLQQIKDKLEDSYWFYRENNEHSDYIYNMIFYNSDYLKFVNKIEPFLTLSNAYKIIISPIFSVCSPLLYIIVPFVLLRIMRIKIPFKFFFKMMWQQSGMISIPFVKNKFMATLIKWFSKFLSIFLYCQNVYNSYSTSRTTLQIVNLFQRKLENIKQLLGFSTKLHEGFSGQISANPKCFVPIEKGEIYCGSTSIFSNKGRILKDFYNFNENKEYFLQIINNIGFIDCYLSLAEKVAEKSYYCIPKLLVQSTPQIVIKNLWHPAVAKNKIVRNDITFHKKKRNYILTGPNAAGKSTFIKSVFLNLYLAQTVGICNSTKAEITPFSYLLTGIRNQDSQGSESLFEAEVHKIRNYLEEIKKQKGFTFSVLDEVFTSTNYQEGFAASYGLCKTIGEMKHCLHIVATHYTKLYKIVKEKELAFRNIRFAVVMDEKGIQFPYKLEKGYSKQFIALRLMKQKDMDNQFLDNCLKYLGI